MEYKNWTESYGKSLNAAIIIGFVALTGVGAGIGAYVSKDKTFGAIMGGLAGFSVIAVPLLNKKFNKGKKRNVNEYTLEEPKSQSDCGDGHEFIPRGGTRKKAFCQMLNIKPYR
jgi:hypothetical protein